MRKLTKVQIGTHVACPVGLDYTQRYIEYECGQIVRFFKNTRNEDCVEVKVWYHLSGKIVFKKVALKNLKQINYPHGLHEKELFEYAITHENELVNYHNEIVLPILEKLGLHF
jgi:hypothetical protein